MYFFSFGTGQNCVIAVINSGSEMEKNPFFVCGINLGKEKRQALFLLAG